MKSEAPISRSVTPSELDVAIVGGMVVDGTGGPAFRADVGVVKDRIVAIGDLQKSLRKTTIDASDLVVSPGFIDAHVHSELALLDDPLSLENLYQGVTSHIVGQDGCGFAPSDSKTIDTILRTLGAIYSSNTPLPPGSIADFLSRYNQASTVNVATLIPNGCVRSMVMGNVDRPPTSLELEAMTELCRQGMRQGAVGISTGLDYVPSGFASTDELVALSAAVKPLGGVYVSHVRYRDGIVAALAEAFDIGRRSGIPVHISHLRPSPGQTADELIGLVNAANDEDLNVTYDGYPYGFGCTVLSFVLPPWVESGSKAEVLARLSDPSIRLTLREELRSEIERWSALELAGSLNSDFSHLIGRTIIDAAKISQTDPVDFVCDLLVAHDLNVLILGVDPKRDEDIAQVHLMLAHKLHLTCSDGIYAAGQAHPRRYGAFAKSIRNMVYDTKLLSLEDAIRHSTFSTAHRFGLHDRGHIAVGKAADIAVFDAEAFTDNATRRTNDVASGMQHVLVNGVIALLSGAPTGATPGRGLRRTTER